MRVISKTLMFAVLGLGIFGGTAHAQTGSISNTGTGSTNTNTFSNTVNTTLTCTNIANITSTNSQTGTSGTATANGNTTVGNVGTGGVSNTSTQSTAVNNSCGGAPASQASATATTSSGQTLAGGRGGGSVLGATSSASVAALPNTGDNKTMVKILTSSVISLGSVGAFTQVAVQAYKRKTLGF